MALDAYEQLFLELVNRARLDPEAEAARQGIALNTGLAAGTIDGSAKQVLAPNALLDEAAAGHSLWMLDTDTFSHTGAGGSTATDRIRAEGYTLSGSWRTGENLSLVGSSGAVDRAAAAVTLHEQLYASATHRPNLMSGAFRETGIGNEIGVFTQNGTDFNASIITQVFATSGSQVFITGVLYDDADGDLFYDIGEGRGGAAIAAGTGKTTAAAAGGYAIGVTAGASVAVSFDWNQVHRALTVDMTAGNVKLDLLADGRLLTSGSVVLGEGLQDAFVLGVKGLSLTGNDLANSLTGGKGDDTLDGGAGADTLRGGKGNDTYIVDDLNDVLIEEADSGTDTVRSAVSWTLAENFEHLELTGTAVTGTGNTLHNAIIGNAANNRLSGLGGNDTLDGGNGNDTLFGGNGNDSLLGGGGNDTLRGDGGNDVLSGGGGHDKLYGGAGNDTLNGDGGNDQLFGDGGADRMTGGAGNDTLTGGAGNDTLFGGAGNDRLRGDGGKDVLYGDAGADSLDGGAGNDKLYGGAGNDTLVGGSGGDQLFGGDGADQLYGGDGNDTLNGGAGNDVLTGGAGADVFVFGAGAGKDRITDFSLGQGDSLRLDKGLWTGDLTVAEVLNAHAKVSGSDLVLSFGTNTLRIEGIGDPDALLGSIELF